MRLAGSFLQKCPLVEMDPSIGRRAQSQEGSTAFGLLRRDSGKVPSEIVAFSRKRDAKRFEQVVAGAGVEVLEVKRALDRVVLGQVIKGYGLARN